MAPPAGATVEDGWAPSAAETSTAGAAPAAAPPDLPNPALDVEWLGEVDYVDALRLQQERIEARRRGASGDVLLLLEHPRVVTLGRRTDPSHLLTPRAELERRGIAVHEVARGGDVTCHEPGQLVGYLIADLAARGRRDVHVHLRRIESCLVEALGELGLSAQTRPGWTGVFVAAAPGSRPTMESAPPRKIASVGVGLRGWISWHGFALNVVNDLRGFSGIVPCGLHRVAMTSLAAELATPVGEAPALARRARSTVARRFARGFFAKADPGKKAS